MERDFWGTNGQEEGRSSRQDSGSIGGSGVQWPFSNKVSHMPQFMSFKAIQEEKSEKLAFDQFSSSGYEAIATMNAFEPNNRSSHVLGPQKFQGAHQLAMHAYQANNTDSCGASSHHLNEARTFPLISHHQIPVAMSSPFFKLHGSQNGPNGPNATVTSLKQQHFGRGIAGSNPSMSSIVGAFAPRNTTKPSAKTAQLTIFYAGAVNVYDDVPLDKARAIMLLASNGSNANSNAANLSPEAPVSMPMKVAAIDGVSLNQMQSRTSLYVASPCSGLSSQVSVTSGIAASVSGIADDIPGGKPSTPSALASQNEPSKIPTTPLGSPATPTSMPRAVPQARKASLARFLEKRKERVTSAMPYPCAKKSQEDTTRFEGVNMSSKTSLPDVSLSSNMEKSWHLSQPKNAATCGKSPSTKLEM